jgi:hypothetical protein
VKDIARAQALIASGAITERRSCLSKVSYPNRNDALHAAKAVANKTGRKTSVYSCGFCRGFHVTKAKYGEEDQNTSDYVEAPPKLRRGTR